jgi:hypothetical protein
MFMPCEETGRSLERGVATTKSLTPPCDEAGAALATTLSSFGPQWSSAPMTRSGCGRGRPALPLRGVLGPRHRLHKRSGTSMRPAEVVGSTSSMGRSRGFEVPPPGAGFTTVSSSWPGSSRKRASIVRSIEVSLARDQPAVTRATLGTTDLGTCQPVTHVSDGADPLEQSVSGRFRQL